MQGRGGWRLSCVPIAVLPGPQRTRPLDLISQFTCDLWEPGPAPHSGTGRKPGGHLCSHLQPSCATLTRWPRRADHGALGQRGQSALTRSVSLPPGGRQQHPVLPPHPRGLRASSEIIMPREQRERRQTRDGHRPLPSLLLWLSLVVTPASWGALSVWSLQSPRIPITASTLRSIPSPANRMGHSARVETVLWSHSWGANPRELDSRIPAPAHHLYPWLGTHL